MTPCEEKGYKVGDRFVVEGSSVFLDGSVVELYEDDDSDCPLFKLIKGKCDYRHADGGDGAYADLEFVTPVRQTQRITLKPGDYVSTEGMDEATYHAVAKALMDAGAKDKGDADFHKRNGTLGWDCRDNELWNTYGKVGGFTNKLSVTDILGTQSTTTDLVDAVRTAKTTLDDARAEYTKALDALREALGEGFVIAEAGDAPDDDMTDPANWRAGDVLEGLSEIPGWWTYGKLYTWKEDDKGFYVLDDEGDKRYLGNRCVFARRFRFHHRPNT